MADEKQPDQKQVPVAHPEWIEEGSKGIDTRPIYEVPKDEVPDPGGLTPPPPKDEVLPPAPEKPSDGD